MKDFNVRTLKSNALTNSCSTAASCAASAQCLLQSAHAKAGHASLSDVWKTFSAHVAMINIDGLSQECFCICWRQSGCHLSYVRHDKQYVISAICCALAPQPLKVEGNNRIIQPITALQQRHI
jgi:hypothetical protein